ncbi:MAG: HAD-IA family hydrolase [Xanthomonadaceae bacterium]|nr:HAD-IA family hydrolase [Xanthomonadaceae bacterium]
MYPVTALFFDLDGTLVDTLPDIARAVNQLRRENGRSLLDREQVQGIVGDGARKLVIRAMGAERETWFQRFLDLYDRDLLCESALYDGIETVLDFYGEKVLACITNKPKALAERVLAGLNIIDRFQLVIGPEDVPRKKPDPAGIFQALAHFSLDPGQAVMIGDHHTDLRSAAAAGVISCFCHYGYGHADGLPAAASISKPLELLAHFT